MNRKESATRASAHAEPMATSLPRTLRLRIKHPKRIASIVLFTVSTTLPIFGAELDETKLPPTAARTVDFDKDVKPILDNACIRCHGPEKPKSKFRLDDRDAALKGGDYGVQIEPGKSGQSRLIHMVAKTDAELEMPPQGKGTPLTPQEVGILRAWIDQGAAWGQSDSFKGPVFTLDFSTGIQWIHVDGNAAKFREHFWQREGWGGGITHFSLNDQIDKDTRLTAEGHFVGNQRDFDFKLGMEKRDLGFVRFGVEQYPRYTADTGWYYQPDGQNSPALDHDLRLDLARVWAEVGLTKPDVPSVLLGYERRTRRGSEAVANWAFYSFDPSNDFVGRGVLPQSQRVDETSHTFKLDASHDLNGTRIEDNLRFELYDLQQSRETTGWFSNDSGERHQDVYDHLNTSNVLRLERQIKDWWLLSGGYLFSSLRGDAGFNQEYFVPSDPTLPIFAGDFSSAIVLKRQAHVFNVNSQFGPWDGLSLSAGIQGDWSSQDGLGDAATRGGTPTHYLSDINRAGFEERFDLRYTKIPYTVLNLETRFAQDRTDQFEQSDLDTGAPPTDEFTFLRDHDSASDLKEFGAGLTVSPWKSVSLRISGTKSDRHHDYDLLTDSDFGFSPGNGYPSFIESRDILTDRLDVKLVTRPLRWLRTTLGYRIEATDFSSKTAPVGVFEIDPDTGDIRVPLTGGGSLDSANYDARAYEVGATITLIQGLYLSGSYTLTSSRLAAAADYGNSIVPYDGEIHSVLSSASYVFDPKTSLRASYSYSQSDFGQDNFADGFPLGIVYDRHGILAGLSRQIRKHVTANLQYGFFQYREPTRRGANDYTAHAIFATLNVSLKP